MASLSKFGGVVNDMTLVAAVKRNNFAQVMHDVERGKTLVERDRNVGCGCACASYMARDVLWSPSSQRIGPPCRTVARHSMKPVHSAWRSLPSFCLTVVLILMNVPGQYVC